MAQMSDEEYEKEKKNMTRYHNFLSIGKISIRKNWNTQKAVEII